MNALLVLVLLPASEPHALSDVRVGARAAAIADMLTLVPDFSRTGSGLGVFAQAALLSRLDLRAGVDVRLLDERLGYCLEKCGLPDVEPPARSPRQMKLVLGGDARLRLLDVAPASFFILMGSGVIAGTSLDATDPLTFGLVNGWGAGVVMDLGGGWQFDTSARWQTGLHVVPPFFQRGNSGLFVVDAGLTYRIDR